MPRTPRSRTACATSATDPYLYDPARPSAAALPNHLPEPRGQVVRVRVATAAGITAVALLALPACSSNNAALPAVSPSAASGSPAATEANGTPLSSAALDARLLDESDLGSGYTRKPERPARHDDVTVLGCPALSDLGGDAATGGSLNFPRQAKTSFTYAGDSDSEVSEELYSDNPAKLSAGMAKIFDAMTRCPEYQVLVGGSVIDITAKKAASPHRGEEQWSHLLTFSVGGHDSVVKQARDPRREHPRDRLRFARSRRPAPRQGPRQGNRRPIRRPLLGAPPRMLLAGHRRMALHSHRSEPRWTSYAHPRGTGRPSSSSRASYVWHTNRNAASSAARMSML